MYYLMDKGLKLMQTTKISILNQPSTFLVGVSSVSISTGGCSMRTKKVMKNIQNSQISDESVPSSRAKKTEYPSAIITVVTKPVGTQTGSLRKAF